MTIDSNTPGSDKSPSQYQSDDEDGIVSFDDAATIGFMIVDMADRVATMDACLPGSEAVWYFTIDERRYQVTVKPAPANEDGEP